MSGWRVLIAPVLIGAGAATITPPVSQVLIDQRTRQAADLTRAELLVLTSDHTMFRLRTTLAETRAGLRPELDRGYSLFCGNWRVEPLAAISTTDRLVESFQYPALAADRDGPHRMTLTTASGSKAGLPAAAHNSDHSYRVVRQLQFDLPQIERIRFTCAHALPNRK